MDVIPPTAPLTDPFYMLRSISECNRDVLEFCTNRGAPPQLPDSVEAFLRADFLALSLHKEHPSTAPAKSLSILEADRHASAGQPAGGRGGGLSPHCGCTAIIFSPKLFIKFSVFLITPAHKAQFSHYQLVLQSGI